GRVVGALTGGASECDGTSTNHASDYFSKLSMSWETGDADNQLKTYLDPSGTGLKQQAGKDPNSDKPLFRMSNADFSAGDMLEVKMSDFTEAIEFAEEFTLKSEVEILGTYILVPPLSSNRVTGVEISIYSGVNSPENLLQTQSFSPQYMNYSSATGFNPRDKTMTGFGTESFVLFDESVKIAGKFFISYKINSPNSFYIYNTKFADEYKQNTAWVKDPSQGWLQVPDWLPGQSEKTSLAIQPLVRGITGNNAAENNDCPLFFDSKSHTLVLTEPASEPILVKVYSHTGALMEKTQIGKGERSVSLAEKTKGTIGIIGLLLSNKFYSGKILY
ncbi:MAG: hypothetical protein LBE71_03125, partial [Dysgonamonadaceae bacterium]|nr:hypothetical protein [Dysgonamonadaceae bacterium]